MQGYYRYTPDGHRVQIIDKDSFPVDPVLLYPELNGWETYDDEKLAELYTDINDSNGEKGIDQTFCINGIAYTNTGGVIVMNTIPDHILLVVSHSDIGKMDKANLAEFKRQVLDKIDSELNYPIIVRYTTNPNEYKDECPSIILSFIGTDEYSVTEEQRGVRYRTYLVRNALSGAYISTFFKRV